MVCRSLPCHVRGGLEFHTLDLAAGLAAEGAEVHLLSAEVPPGYRAEIESRGLRLFEIPGVPAGRYSLAYLKAAGPIIERLHREHPYDIIHAQEFGFGLWNPPSDLTAKIVLTVHGTITSETPLHPDVFMGLSAGGKFAALMRFGRRYLFAPAWRRMLGRADLILVDSLFTHKELARIMGGDITRIRHVPLGVEMSRYPPLDHSEARAELGWPEGEGAPVRLLTVGRLTWQKGHARALQALAELKDLAWKYVIVGEGPEEKALERLIDKLGLKDRVELIGRVEESRRNQMLAAADLFIWPERTHPAFGLVGLEAMLMNTPVLAASRGAIPEIVDDRSGWLFDVAPEDLDDGDEMEEGFPMRALATLGGRRPKQHDLERAHDRRRGEDLADILRARLTYPSSLAFLRDGLRERTLVRFAPAAMVRQTLDAYQTLLNSEEDSE